MKPSWVERGNKVLSPALAHYTTLEVIRGDGSHLIGRDGKRYLDFSSGIAVTNTGHCHPRVVAAACQQTGKLIHACSGIVYYEPHIALAEKLQKIVPVKNGMTFFGQSGAEAVEAALKMARYVTRRPGIIAFKGGFHGRTFGALSITTSKKKYREGYQPLLPKVYIAPYAYCYRCSQSRVTSHQSPVDTPFPEPSCKLECLEGAKKLIKRIGPKSIAAMVVEPVQGEGGYIVPPREFIRGLQKLCRRYELLFILDEVQTGFGRTGKMFAADYFGVLPDGITLGKGIASGFPLSAFVARAELMKKWPPGAHGSTMTGNPVTTAAALATINVMEREKLVANSAKLGKYLKQELLKLKDNYSIIGDVRGLGMMIGVEFTNPEIVKKIREFCLSKGLILISCGTEDQVIRWVPPLNATKSEIDRALAIFGNALAESTPWSE